MGVSVYIDARKSFVCEEKRVRFSGLRIRTIGLTGKSLSPTIFPPTFQPTFSICPPTGLSVRKSGIRSAIRSCRFFAFYFLFWPRVSSILFYFVKSKDTRLNVLLKNTTVVQKVIVINYKIFFN